MLNAQLLFLSPSFISFVVLFLFISLIVVVPTYHLQIGLRVGQVKLDQNQGLKNEWEGGRFLEKEGGSSNATIKSFPEGEVPSMGESYVEIVRKEQVNIKIIRIQMGGKKCTKRWKH